MGEAAFVLVLAGGSASGKTTLGQGLGERLGAAGLRWVVVGMDGYFRRGEAGAPVFRFSLTGAEEFDCNEIESVDWRRALADLDGLSGIDVVVLDCHLGLALREVRARGDLLVYVDVPDDVRAVRRMVRDVREGRNGGGLETAAAYYLESARRGHERYVGPSRVFAELVLDGCREVGDLAEELAGEVLGRIGARI